MPTVPDIHRRGTRATQPAATTVTIGTLYFVTDENVTERSNGTAWESFSAAAAGGGGAAPLPAPYLVAASDAALSAERVATNSGTVTWDFSTPGQATAHVVDGVVRPEEHAMLHETGGRDPPPLARPGGGAGAARGACDAPRDGRERPARARSAGAADGYDRAQCVRGGAWVVAKVAR